MTLWRIGVLLKYCPVDQTLMECIFSQLNASRLALVSSSIDAQLLTTCFKVRTTTDASVGGGVEVVERCRLWGSEGSGPIFSLGVAPDLDLLITGKYQDDDWYLKVLHSNLMLKLWHTARSTIPTCSSFYAVFVGHAERELMLWRLTDWTSIPGVPLGGHTGWVRTLAIGKKIIIRWDWKYNSVQSLIRYSCCWDEGLKIWLLPSYHTKGLSICPNLYLLLFTLTWACCYTVYITRVVNFIFLNERILSLTSFFFFLFLWYCSAQHAISLKCGSFLTSQTLPWPTPPVWSI